MIKLSSQIDVLKSSRAQRLHNYYGLRKSRVDSRTVRPGKARTFWDHFARKCWSNGRFLDFLKIGNGSKINPCRQDRHRDPLKTVPGSGFEKTWKNNEISIENERFLMAKIYWKCRTVIDFMVLGHSQKWWKNDAKRDLTNHVFWMKIATWASQLRLILWFLTFWCDAKKPWFF